MRHFKKSLITFAATAALLAPAGLATASSHSASAPAKASSSDCLTLCFDIYIEDVLSGNQVLSDNNVPVSVAAIACNTTVPVLSAFNLNQTAACNTTSAQPATVTRVL